jgi:hypothetical protein
MMGGTLALNNVRLAHKRCNREDSQSRVLAQNLIKLFGMDEAGKVLKSLESPGERQSLTIKGPLEGDQPARLRLIEALRVEQIRATRLPLRVPWDTESQCPGVHRTGASSETQDLNRLDDAVPAVPFHVTRAIGHQSSIRRLALFRAGINGPMEGMWRSG